MFDVTHWHAVTKLSKISYLNFEYLRLLLDKKVIVKLCLEGLNILNCHVKLNFPAIFCFLPLAATNL